MRPQIETNFKEEYMSILSISASWMNISQILPQAPTTPNNTSSGNLAGQSSGSDSYSGSSGIANLGTTSNNYSIESLLVQYQSSDGDSVSLSSQSLQSQQAQLSADGSNSSADWKQIVSYLKQQFESLKDEIRQDFFKNNGLGANSTQTASTTSASQTSSADGIPGLPDYWSSENTSQRIVDFATSFLSAFKGSGSDFLSTIKDAIEKGFSEALGTTGKLPDAVSKLVSNTHDLVMQKLDAWAKAQGITVTDDTGSDSTSSTDQAAAA
jgi:Domain of unknown function (DUF5610)